MESEKVVELIIADILNDILHGLSEKGIVFHLFFYLVEGVDDGGVIPSAKFLPNRSHGHLCDLPDHVDRHLSRFGDIGISFVGFDITGGDGIGARDLIDDFFNGDGHRLVII